MIARESGSQDMKTTSKKRMSRNTLEKLLAEKSKEIVQNNAEMNELKKCCTDLKVEIKEWKSKADNLAKTCKDLASLVKSHIGPQISPKKLSGPTLSSRKRSSDSDKDASPTKDTKKRRMAPEPKEEPSLPSLPNQTSSSLSTFPKPVLELSKTDRGLEVLWNFDTEVDEKLIKSYELYSCNSKSTSKSGASWKKVGVINSITLPIKVTLSDFKSNSTYYFSIRPKDQNDSYGPYSEIEKIDL